MFEMSTFNLRRHGLTALGVLSLHAGLIWVLHNSLIAPVPEVIVPVSLLAQAPAPSAPSMASPAPKAVATPPKPAAAKTSPQAKPAPSPAPQATPVPATEANNPVTAPAMTSAVNAQASTVAAPPSSAGAGSAAASASSAPAVQLPSSDADYLRNPKPVYPALSKRLNEQGTVIHSVLIAADGKPVSAKLAKSSGYDRLDKAAYDAVMQWRYVPGKRQGMPEAMTFNVPIKWVLE